MAFLAPQAQVHFHFQPGRERLGLLWEMLGFPTSGELPHRALCGFMPTLSQAPANSRASQDAPLTRLRRDRVHVPSSHTQQRPVTSVLNLQGERKSFSHGRVPFDLPHCPPESLIVRRSPPSKSSPAFSNPSPSRGSHQCFSTKAPWNLTAQKPPSGSQLFRWKSVSRIVGFSVKRLPRPQLIEAGQHGAQLPPTPEKGTGQELGQNGPSQNS